MPLADHLPELDDRTFEDLLREARLRIPRYCPEWTDFNDSDPGMALVQLFAWFTELLLYRYNLVPERNYLKFLQMLNLEPRPARPARAHVCLTPTPGGRPVRLPARSRCEAAAGGDTLFFETTRAIDLVPYALDAVQVLDGAEFTDFTAVNDGGTGSFRPFGWAPQPGNALYLGFKPEPAEPAFPDRVVLRVFLPPPAPTAAPRPSRGTPLTRADQVVVWEYRSKLDLIGSQSADAADRWRPLGVLSDDTLALTREGTVELRGPGPDILATKVGKPTADDGPRYWVRCRFAQGEFPADRVPEVAFVRANVVEVENLATFENEPLGESDGFPRDYPLRHKPVVPESLEIEVDGDSDDDPWVPRDDFLDSGPNDKHFTVNPNTAVVQFGDGGRGRVPPPGGLVVARKYLSGGGKAGNLKAGAITAPPLGVTGIDEVTNPRPATGGADEETIAQLKARAPQALRGDGRAVTADDYRRFAERVPGVGRATVLERSHPDYPGFEIPGTVTVVVIPDALPRPEPGRPTRPLPTQELLDRVASDLNRLRTVGTELFVTGPRYRVIEVRARVVPADGATDAQAREGVKREVEDFLAPLPRPEPKPPTVVPAAAGAEPRPAKKPPRRNPNGWPFGEPFYPSQLYEVILSAADDEGRLRLVRSVTDLRLTVDGQEWQLGDAVQFDREPDTLPACVAQVDIDPNRREGA